MSSPYVFAASDEKILLPIATALEYQEVRGDFRRVGVGGFQYLNVGYQMPHPRGWLVCVSGSGANPRDPKSQAVLVVVKETQPQRRAEVLFAPIHAGPHRRP